MAGSAPALRPLGVGDVIDRVITIYRRRPLLFIALAAVPYLALGLAAGLLTLAFAGTFVSIAPLLSPGAADSAAFGRLAGAIGGLAVFVLLFLLITLIAVAVQSGALVDAAAARYLGRESTLGASFRAGLRGSLRLIGAGFLAFLAILLLWIVLIIAMVVISNAAVIAILVLFGVVAMFFLVASWLIAPAVATVEGTAPLATLRRSWHLSAGHRWRVLGLLFLLLILQGILGVLLSTVLLATFAIDTLARNVLQQVVNLTVSVLWAPIQWGTFTVLYYDLRVRKEAYDLQLAAEALPRQ
ncbi:MAG: hypothetical protein M3O91_10055 [Chloroflexota bacterium]|nr:hypothetical protein [Chloroflexota bacterium]